jgi:hypothetical protein
MKRDVQLLRNRVRMLEQEYLRAEKKIAETETRAQKLFRLKEENNQRYLQEVELKERRAQESMRSVSGVKFSEIRHQQLESVKEAKVRQFSKKYQEAQAAKDEK